MGNRKNGLLLINPISRHGQGGTMNEQPANADNKPRPASSSRTAFVTGATGFLGLNLVHLLSDAGWDVIALHRPQSDLKYLQRFQVRRAVAAIEDRAALEQAMPPGVDVVFHTAADVSYWSGHKARQTRTNVEGTRNLVDVALRRGVKKFVHTSSTGIYGLTSQPVDETSPHLGRGSWFNYQHTKVLAEDAVRDGIAKGMDAVFLNPANIVGPYDLHNWSRLIRLAAEGRLYRVPPGGGSFCHVAEVARAHVAAVSQGRTGENYILAGADASYAELIGTLAEVMQCTLNTRVVHWRLLRGLGRILNLVSRVTGREPFMTPEAAAYLSANVICRHDKASRELGYRAVPLRTMLEDCYRWMLAEGLLPAPVTVA
jgi:nucleoside-diphosphate-sugar epimerase